MNKLSLLCRYGVSYSLAQLKQVPRVLSPMLLLIPLQSMANAPATENADVNPYSDTLSRTASTLASTESNGAAGAAASAASSYASSSVEGWLSQFGTARVQLNVDNNGNWDDSSFDFLLPFYDNKKTVIFTQLGMRAPDDRFTGNLGFGVRTFNASNWMFGINSFIDDDFTGGNRRAGFGGEAWTDDLKLSANGYVGITDWHSSRDFDDYDEKPANGFDIRAEGYLPTYPQLGAKVMYEQYYGDNVALFDTDHLQKDPSAVTVGLNYTPIPLVTAGIDYKRGQDSVDDTQFSLAFHYVLGQSLSSQLSGDQVAYRRSLAGSRYDLVERNNEIVLDYRKQEKPTPDAPTTDLAIQIVRNGVDSDGTTKDFAVARVTDSDGTPMANVTVNWSVSGSAKLARASSTTDSYGLATVGLTDAVAETVDVTATVEQQTKTSKATFVEGSGGDKTRHIVVSTVRGAASADGQDRGILKAVVTDENGKPMSHKTVAWSDSSDTAKGNKTETITNDSGVALFALTDTVPEKVTVTAKMDDISDSGSVTFIQGSQIITNVEMSAVKNGVIADGVHQNIVQVSVENGQHEPAAGETVSWSLVSPSSKAEIKHSTTVTDAKGNAYISFTDTAAEDVQVQAKVGEHQMSFTSNFIAESIGQVDGPIPLGIGSDDVVNINESSGGVDFQITPYAGMKEGDQIVLHFQVYGDDGGPSYNPRSQTWTSSIHTVTASEVGHPITINAPQSAFYDDNGIGITDTDYDTTGAYAVVKSVSGQTVKSSFTHMGVATIMG